MLIKLLLSKEWYLEYMQVISDEQKIIKLLYDYLICQAMAFNNIYIIKTVYWLIHSFKRINKKLYYF